VVIDSTYNVGIPDIFSPGTNGSKNSSWYIFGNRITKIDVKVFNRYGQIVFSTDKIEDIVWESDIAPVGGGWNGSYNNEIGKELDPGVYTYTVKVFHETGRVYNYTGNVTLVR
jgi:gliding motility-associated-like protein